MNTPPPPLGPRPIPGNHDLNELELILADDASTHLIAFLANWFLRGRLIKIFL